MDGNQGNDIRSRVEDDRSILKKIELAIPGFAGYREKEDIRTSDELLRSQISGKIDRYLHNLKEARQNLATCFKLNNLNQLAMAISNMESLKNKIYDAEQGYSGIAFPVNVDDSVLDRIYEFDYSFINSVESAGKECDKLNDPCSMDDNTVMQIIVNINNAIKKSESAWQERIETVENIKVK